MITDHWFRADSLADPCVYSGCGVAFEDHAEACGEWTDPKHFYVPLWGGCARCGRSWYHSTHWGSPKNRRLWIWPGLREGFFRTKDRIMRRETCRHFSHRLKLPCFRRIDSCSGRCERHYHDCSDGCP